MLRVVLLTLNALPHQWVTLDEVNGEGQETKKKTKPSRRHR